MPRLKSGGVVEALHPNVKGGIVAKRRKCNPKTPLAMACDAARLPLNPGSEQKGSP